MKSFKEIGIDHSLPHIYVIMERTIKHTYKNIELPDGFYFSTYKDGFDKQFGKLLYAVEEVDSITAGINVFHKTFLQSDSISTNIKTLNNYSVMVKNLVFICNLDGRVVASGALWPGRHFGKELIRLHWITVLPSYQNLGLSKAIVKKLLAKFDELYAGEYLYLSSQTQSYKALSIYSTFGFTPYFGPMPTNWKLADIEPKDFTYQNNLAWKIINQQINSYKNK